MKAAKLTGKREKPSLRKGLKVSQNGHRNGSEASYAEFLKGKAIVHQSVGVIPKDVHPILFPFQRDIVKWALRRGRAETESANDLFTLNGKKGES